MATDQRGSVATLSGRSHRRRVARIEVTRRILLEVELAALSTEEVLAPFVDAHEPLRALRLAIDRHPANGIDRAVGCFGLVSRSCHRQLVVTSSVVVVRR